MKKSLKKLTLNRDTVYNLSSPALEQAAAAMNTGRYCRTVSCNFSCAGTCAFSVCLPSCGNCTVIC